MAIVGRAHRPATRGLRPAAYTEEKRCGVEALGAEMIGRLTYYERWIVAFANILFRKEILTPTELAVKMREVEARRPDDR